MILQRFLSGFIITALCAAPALAKPTVIAELGTAPLLGTSRSTTEMRQLVAHNEGIMSAAAVRLGLTPGEYAQFHAAIDQSHVAWVTVPRHLDAMTWQAGGHVYALHNVIIPKHTNGWEVDVPAAHGAVLALYMPAKCGNLSLVRRPARAIARRVAPPVHVALVAPPPAAPPVQVAYVPPPPPDDVAAPVAAPATEFPPAPAAASKPRFLFLAPLLFGIAALAAGSGSGPIAAPPVGCP
jgi:hypothetical protein